MIKNKMICYFFFALLSLYSIDNIDAKESKTEKNEIEIISSKSEEETIKEDNESDSYYDEKGKTEENTSINQSYNNANFKDRDEISKLSFGWTTINNERYYIDELGDFYKNKWLYEDDGTTYYFLSDGRAAMDKTNIDGDWYYFDSGNRLYKKGWKIINGKYYFFDKTSGIMYRNTWFTENGNKYYLNEEGESLTGFVEIDGNTYYFNDNGEMQTGMFKINNRIYYAYNGKLYKDNWLEMRNNKYFFGSDNSAYIGFKEINGNSYYFNDNGEMQSGLFNVESKLYYGYKGKLYRNSWLETGNQKYYFGEDCSAKIGKQNVSNQTYYFDLNHKLYKAGWKIIDGVYYYFDQKSGEMQRAQWLEEGANKYYLDSTGKAQTGFFEYENNRYYFNKRGQMQTGFIQVNGNLYYGYNGKLFKNSWLESQNNKYYFNENYEAAIGRIVIDDSTYYFDSGYKMYTGWKSENGDYYYFDIETGALKKGRNIINRRVYDLNEKSGKFMSMSAPVPYYMQTDPRWKDKKYGGNTMKSSGCAQTCAAMIFSFLKNETILPTDVANWGHKNNYFNGIMDGERFGGTIGSFWPAVAKHYGFTARGNLTVDQAINDLRHGKLMIAGMNPPNFTFYGSTHAIVIYGIDENNYVSVYDPYFKEHNKKYPISQIFKEKSTDPDDKMSGGPIFTIG